MTRYTMAGLFQPGLPRFKVTSHAHRDMHVAEGGKTPQLLCVFL